MKKLLLISAVLCTAYISNAQKSKVSGAQSFLNSGKLDKAKESIDLGIKHEKCKAWSKAYLVKGKVYQGIFESPLPAYKELAEKPLDIAYEAYLKALELDQKGKMLKPVKGQMTNLIPDYTNEAITLFNKGDYDGALAAFEKVLEIQALDMFKDEHKVDTAVIYNAGLTAVKAKKYEKAVMHYKNALKHNYSGSKVYANLANVLKKVGKKEESISYLNKGVELFPNDAWMMTELINYYTEEGESQKAIEYLDKVIAVDPQNATYYRAKGILFDKLERTDESIKAYEKAIELDPNDYIPKYNIAAIKVNRVSEHHKQVLEIMDAKKYNEGIKVVYQEYIDVIPYFDAVLEIKPDEKNSIMALKEIYFKLRNQDSKYMDKYNEMKDKLDAL